MRFKVAGVLTGFVVLLSSCAQSTQTIKAFSNRKSTYYYNLGMANLTAENYAQAIADFKKALLLDKNNYRAYDKLALAYADVNDYQDAVRNIDSAISIKPDYYKAVLDKAFILQKYNYTKEAMQTLNLCIESDFCGLKPQAYYMLANIYKGENNEQQYMENLNMAVLYNRHFNVARLELAKAYVKNNMCEYKSIEKKVMYLLDFQNTPDIMLLKAKCLIEARNLDDASKLIKSVLYQGNLERRYRDEATSLLKDIIRLKH